ncbi:MAG: VanZ family protein [Lacipirellulaceae bacterium]
MTEAPPAKRRQLLPSEPYWRWTLVAGFLALFAATHAPTIQLPQVSGWNTDKVVHFVAYFTLATLFVNWRRAAGSAVSRWTTVALCVFLAAWAAFDELTQPLVNRVADHRDWMADAMGVATALVLDRLVQRWRRSDGKAEPQMNADERG